MRIETRGWKPNAIFAVSLACALFIAKLVVAPGSLGLQTGPTIAPLAASQDEATDPRTLYRDLNDLRADAAHVYTIEEVNLRRDIINLRLKDGKLAFLQSLDGRITGAVFTGHGHIFATPRDRGERQSLAQFLRVPILDQTFSRCYLRFTDDTASEIRQQLESAGATSAKDQEFADSWAQVIGNLNPWHSLRIMFDWLSTDPLPYFYAGIGSDAVGPFDVLVDARRDEQVLMGQPHFANGVRLYDSWASFRSQDAPKKPIRSFAPLDYLVDSSIADDLSLEGETMLHVKTQRAGERVLALELSRNLVIEEVKLKDGEPLAYFQNEDMSRHDILSQGNDSLLVVLPAAAKSGEEFQVEVKYRGSVISDAGNGVAFVGEHGTWYAHTVGADQFVPFDLSFRWPKRFTLVATGTRIESREEGDVKTGRWKSDVPFTVAGFNLGEYKTETAAGDLPKIQLYANQQLENAILAMLYKAPPHHTMAPRRFDSPGDPGALGPADLPPPSPAAYLKRLGGQVSDSIHFFSAFNGPFPFDHLDVSQIPGNFGQGWPELVYLSTLVFLSPEAQKQAGLAEQAQEETRELMPFHEVAHQWWGNVVGAATYRDAWIQEGVANYLALLYLDARKPNDHRLASWLERYRDALSAKAGSSAEIAGDAGPLSFGPRLMSSKVPTAYETITYGKGTWVIHMLHEMLRDSNAADPDERFRKLLLTILTDHRFHSLSTDDFQRAVERFMTPAMDLEGTHSMDWFFDQWVRGTGIPHYAVDFKVTPHGQEYLVTGTLVQSGVEAVFTSPVPLYGSRPGGKQERLGVVVTTGAETHFRFVAKFRPLHILIDPRLTVLSRMN